MINSALETTEGMLDLLAGVMETLIVHEERMSELLVDSWCTASNLADTIVRESGMSFRQAHHVVARVVRDSLAAGIKPAELTGAALDQASRETTGVSLSLGDELVRDALNPRRFVETRVTTGSVGPSEVDQLLVHAQAEREADREWVEAARRRLALARTELDRAVAGIVT
ncbi:MAG: argininosuccinate lyase [Gammaproteobacteria bacterium]|nr:argininosuccinate lyase [Gammaproteobacteria bacterium]